MTRWKCRKCSYIYDPVRGDPDGGIPPGTPFARIPDSWRCPVCGATKADFYELAVPAQAQRPGAATANGAASTPAAASGAVAAQTPPGPGPLPVSTPAERRAAGEADPRDAPPVRPHLGWTVGPLKGQR